MSAIVTSSGMQYIRSDMTDTFNRASFANPEFWKTLTGTPAITSSTYYQNNPMSAVGTIFEMATDNIRADFTINGKNPGGKTAVMICCNAAFNNRNVSVMIETGFANNYLHIQTNDAWANGTATDVATKVSSTFNNGDTAGISYTLSDNTFRAYHNSSLIMSWVDTSPALHGPGRRYCGIVMSDDSTTYAGVGIDNIRFYTF